jgi:hypothetical protein
MCAAVAWNYFFSNLLRVEYKTLVLTPTYFRSKYWSSVCNKRDFFFFGEEFKIQKIDIQVDNGILDDNDKSRIFKRLFSG